MTRRPPTQLMMSAMIRVRNAKGNYVEARALLDTCSTANFITDTFARDLRLPMQKCSIPVGAINALNTTTKHRVEITFMSRVNDFAKTLTFLTIPRIADRVPDEPFPRDSVEIPSNIKLADPQFHIPRSVDMLIGSGATLSFLSIGQVNISRNKGDLILQKTRLGWVIAGDSLEQKDRTAASCNLSALNEQLEKFWEIEEVGTEDSKVVNDSACERHYVTYTTRDRTGRYVVRLPFNPEIPDLGNSRAQALRRFHALRRKLGANEELRREYIKVMDEYIALGHMSLVQSEATEGYYLPHHAVIKPSSNTTKVRVVFDASAKSDTGVSLNDRLLVGPTIQPKLFEHLIRFRSYAFGLKGDIEKMYRQVLIHPDDRCFQRIFWLRGQDVAVYELNTVTFGVASAPFLAVRTLQQLADDERDDFPRAAKILKRDMYVDDLLTGANSIEELVQIRDELIKLLKRGGFNIRQWGSNHQHAFDGWLDDDPILELKNAEIGDPVSKTLGVIWDSRIDKFVYSVNEIEIPARITKRVILSEIAKIFDPIGSLGPVILSAKSIVQECWREKCDWDESVSQELQTRWVEFARQLKLIRNFTIERKILIFKPVRIELHGFCDASQTGYGACIYMRSLNRQGECVVRLACAKSRVAPTKAKTIPQLELCGALLLVRLFKEMRRSIDITIDRVIFWSDSTIVLHWLKKESRTLRVFEANRVSEIQALEVSHEWRHVRTKDNPADALSRGQLPSEFLVNKTWLSGPEWLVRPEEEWPETVLSTPSELPGLRSRVCLLTETETDFFARFSSYTTLLHVIAYCLRMRPSNRFKGKSVSVEEKIEAERVVLRTIQRERFSEEIALISASKSVKNPRLAAFDPILDEHGILRVGGRLKYAPIPFDQKHPILLPSKHLVSDLIIRDAHQRTLHAGVKTTLHTIRQRFWLIDGTHQVRHLVRRCVECVRNRQIPIYSKMGDLPEARVTEAPAFAHVGVDFFGPLYIKEKKLRNRNRIKAYGCVFVCMASKAVHLEIVSDLTTEGFLGAFRRFCGRRGIPNRVFSDNGTNFVGANNQLKEMYALLNSDGFRAEVDRFAVQRGIVWSFNPPLSPHFGGLWEAAVKSFKHHFKRVVGEQLLTFEVLNTLSIEIEAILNSRPLCVLSNDPNDPTAITPAHLLIGRPISFLPEVDLSTVPGNRLSVWRFITRARQDFWKRWNLEYLHELQRRQKWRNSNHRFGVGDVVLLVEKGLSCSRWRMGVIVETHPGADGVVRVVSIKTAYGVAKRNVTQLCPLPVAAEDF